MLNGKEIITNKTIYEKIDYSQNKKFKLIKVHLLYSDPSINSPKHWHNGLEIIIPLKASFLLNVNGKNYLIEKNNIGIVNSREIHETKIYGKEGTYYDCFVIQISKEYINKTKPDLLNTYFYNSQKFEQKFLISHITNYLFKEYSHYLNDNDDTVMESLIDVILSTLFKYGKLKNISQKKIDSKDHLNQQNTLELVLQTMKYIDKNFEKELNIEKLANYMNYSYGYLAKVFKEHTKMTIKQYLKEKRLQKSLDDLLHSSLSITEIALNNGYPNIKSFIHDFKNNFDMTPNDFRKKMRKSY